ncbi:MAG: hypothetical protein JO125_03790 [Chloroflexi bacterium]|nr:hypothetical protein [Ktedonobacteraceae bacterium]MBV9706512.1 hypothetical protein [Chloroflexota bacterium]
MIMEHVKEIANAVLYEGYLLYPYRHSAIKNRQRWTIGIVYPREYSEANGAIEPWMMHTECLISGGPDVSLDVIVRFLHLLVRTEVRPETASAPSQAQIEANEWGLASRLANEPREEGVEREVSAQNLSLNALLAQQQRIEIAFPAGRTVEPLSSPAPSGATEIVREQQAVAGALIIGAEQIGPELFKLTIQIENLTPDTAEVTGRFNAIFLRSFISTHALLQVHGGKFISLLEPPEELKETVQGCKNVRTWPVLVGNEGEYDTMLSSPIILYDYPQIAPESPGALFDGTEIDEILMLRIMTLSDEEKEQIKQGDEHARQILERTESISPEQFMKLHGVIRSMQPSVEGEEHE